MRYLTIILLCFVYTFSISQTCEIQDNKTINCTDSASLKQGFWFEYNIQKILTTDSFKRNPNAIGLHNTDGKIITPIAEGFYKDSKKVGQWIYYVGSLFNDSYNPTFHQKIVNYSDSGFYYEVDTFWHFVAKVSNDTNNLEGTLNLKGDTVNVFCKHKLCYILDPYRKNKKQIFPYKDLESKLIWMNFRSYNVKKLTI